MTLIQQNPWLLVPYALMMLVMVHAMMEYTVSLLAVRPRSRRSRTTRREMRALLLGLNGGDRPHPLVAGADCDLEIVAESQVARPPGRLAIAVGGERVHIRILLDEQRREVRINQTSRSYAWFLGLSGWLPAVRGHASFRSGPPAQDLTREIFRVAGRRGWAVRPVVWGFQATHSGMRTLDQLTPAPLRRWPARRFWGLVYPLSYTLGMGYLLVFFGPLSAHTLLLALGISAAWWGVWGALVWVLLGLPAFWRRRRN